MPFLLFIIAMISIIGFHTNSLGYEENYSYQNTSDVRWGKTLGGQLTQMQLAIKQHADDERVTEWNCTLVFTVCADEYVRTTTDDGYTDSASWESDLIPVYIPFVDLPDGWSMDVQNTANAMYVCSHTPGSPQDIRVIRNIVEPGVFISDGCQTGNAISIDDAIALGGGTIYVVKQFKK